MSWAKASERFKKRRVERVKCRCDLALRSSGRVDDKVPSPNAGARAAQLNREMVI
jgi:hypothetical protein